MVEAAPPHGCVEAANLSSPACPLLGISCCIAGILGNLYKLVLFFQLGIAHHKVDLGTVLRMKACDNPVAVRVEPSSELQKDCGLKSLANIHMRRRGYCQR